MVDKVDIINYSIVIASLTISISGLLLACILKRLDRWTKRFFILFFSGLTLYAVSDLTSQISLTLLDERFWQLSKAAVFFESLFSSVLMPLLTVYMLKTCRQSFHCLLLYSVGFLWTVYTALLIVTQFTTSIYRVTHENVYMRGPAYPVLLIPPVLIMAVNLIGLLRRRKLMSAKEFRTFLIYLLIPMFSMVIQMNSYGILMIVLGSAVSALFLFVFILNDLAQKSIEEAHILAEQKLKLRTLQINPHFIYNTMSNIYYLCALDPEKAQRVVGDFTNYLRKNISAIEKNDMIPFSDELEHAKAFLAVAKARYESMIFVEYDTEYTSFRVPPLTVEPLVENAVKHGLDPEQAPLNIWIKTTETDAESIITVENTGTDDIFPQSTGFIDEKEDNNTHIGLMNTRERLKTLCSGTLTITGRDGGGIKATIRIPKNKDR